MYFPRLGQVCDASVRAHKHVRRVQGAFEEAPFTFAEVNAAERGLRKVVRLH